MPCEITERISLLMDAELSVEEARQMKEHLFGCALCRQAHQDFVSLREQLRSYETEVNEFAKQRALREILAAQPAPFWRRQVALPVPVLGFLVLIVVALAALTISLGGREGAQPIQEANERPTKPASQAVAQRGIDFSRYDTGERAVIFKTRRAEAMQTGQ